MSDVKNQVRTYITDNFIMGSAGSAFKDSDSFMEKHIIDSTGFLELVTYLEETYNFVVADEEMVPDFTSDNNSSCSFWRGDW